MAGIDCSIDKYTGRESNTAPIDQRKAVDLTSKEPQQGVSVRQRYCEYPKACDHRPNLLRPAVIRAGLGSVNTAIPMLCSSAQYRASLHETL
jgi:hypothetical protein